MRTANCATCWIVGSFTSATGVQLDAGGGGGGGVDAGGGGAVFWASAVAARKVASRRAASRSDGLMLARSISGLLLVVCETTCVPSQYVDTVPVRSLLVAWLERAPMRKRETCNWWYKICAWCGLFIPLEGRRGRHVSAVRGTYRQIASPVRSFIGTFENLHIVYCLAGYRSEYIIMGDETTCSVVEADDDSTFFPRKCTLPCLFPIFLVKLRQ